MARAIPASQLKGCAAVNAFARAVEAAGLPMFVPEWRFAFPRRWKFDYGWPDEKVALEVEGGVWTKGGGRHNRGVGYLNDIAKYNRATLMGWRVIRCTPDTLCSVETLEMLKALLLENQPSAVEPMMIEDERGPLIKQIAERIPLIRDVAANHVEHAPKVATQLFDLAALLTRLADTPSEIEMERRDGLLRTIHHTGPLDETKESHG